MRTLISISPGMRQPPLQGRTRGLSQSDGLGPRKTRLGIAPKIGGCGLGDGRIVAEHAQHAVAAVAEQPADASATRPSAGTTSVVVIHDPRRDPVALRIAGAANCAPATLRREQLSERFLRHAELPELRDTASLVRRIPDRLSRPRDLQPRLSWLTGRRDPHPMHIAVSSGTTTLPAATLNLANPIAALILTNR